MDEAVIAGNEEKNRNVKDAWMDSHYIHLMNKDEKTGEESAMKVTVRNFIKKFNHTNDLFNKARRLLNVINPMAQITLFELRRVDKDNDFFKNCDPKLITMADEAIAKAKVDPNQQTIPFPKGKDEKVPVQN